MSVTDRNERRLKRMNTWISHAKEISDKEEEAHVRFLFYWIAYEAAHQTYQVGDSEVKDWQSRQDLHGKLARYDKGRLQRILHAQKDDVVSIFGVAASAFILLVEGGEGKRRCGNGRSVGECVSETGHGCEETSGQGSS